MADAMLRAEADHCWRLVNRGLDTNTYLLRGHSGRRAVVIDPGLDSDALGRELTERSLVVGMVLCTHGHFDHIAGAAVLQRATGCRVLLHEADRRTARAANLLMLAMRIPGRIDLPEFEYLEGDDTTVTEDGLSMLVRHTPGHTPGSCTIAQAGRLFTGDTLFTQGIDASKFPGSSHAALRHSVRSLFAAFAGSSMVFPGHGEPASLASVQADNHVLAAFLTEPEGAA